MLASVLAATPVCAQNNPVTAAPMRLRVEKIPGTDWPAKMGVVDIAPCLGSSSGFGVFNVKPRKTGIGRNPRTGAEVSIPPGKAVRFKPGKELQTLQ